MNSEAPMWQDPETYRMRWWITATIMLVAIIEVLDMTIVNVALPDMMGSLGANTDQITWVLTSYIVSAAIFMPLTGLLVKRLGRKRLLLVNIVGFLISSMLCGMSVNLAEMVTFRTLQGIFGASLVPISQFVLRDTFPPREQGVAMAIWGMGIMSAPVLGPTLGGYIVDHWNWRWVFYINLPVCVVAYFMSVALIQETERHKTPIDWWGVALMAAGIGALQLFLDRGNTVDWFESSSTWWLTITFIFALSWFFWRCLRVPNPVINLYLFKDRNFALSVFLIMFFVMMVFGQLTLSPLMLQTVYNYPSNTAGLMMAPRGLASMVAMAIAGRLMSKYDIRAFIFCGVIFAAWGTYEMSVFSSEMSIDHYVIGSLLQGFGLGLYFVPIATLSMSNLPSSSVPEASGLFSFSRSLGTSIGISVMTTMLTRSTQANWNTLGGHINAMNGNLQLWLQRAHYSNSIHVPPSALAAMSSGSGNFYNAVPRYFSLNSPSTYQVLATQLTQQAKLISFNNIAWFAAITLLLVLPLVFLLRRPRYGANVDAGGIH